MPLYKPTNSSFWWMTLVNPRTNKRIRKSTKMKDKRQAQLVEEQLMASLILGQHHYMIVDKRKRTWSDAVERWLKEKKHIKDYRNCLTKALWLNQHLQNVKLSDITTGMLKDIFHIKQKEASAATANRHLSFVRSVLNRAHREWGWIDTVPHIPMQKEDTKRVRFLTSEEAECLLKELPPHLKAMAEFTLNTGLRASNVYGLTWKQINLEQQHLWIEAEQAKAKKPISVPLNAGALRILKEQQGKHAEYVFTFKGKNITTSPNNSAWIKALKRANIQNFRWHDLRHTWATWHIQAGTPLHILQELGGWSSYDMVRRYAHLSSDHLRGFCENI